VYEFEGIAKAADDRKIEGSIEFQCPHAAPMVQAIFAGTTCGLATLAQSAQQHPMF
jgi:hypothetical protein